MKTFTRSNGSAQERVWLDEATANSLLFLTRPIHCCGSPTSRRRGLLHWRHQRLADRIDTASPQWAACPAFARRAAEPSHPSSKFEHPFCLPSLSPKTPFAFVPPERLPQGAEQGLGADSPQQTGPFHPLKSSKCLFLGFDQHSVRTAQIRAQEKSRSGRRVPIIAVTEGTRTESCQACLDFRMDDDITHSLHPGQLGLLLARVARGRED